MKHAQRQAPTPVPIKSGIRADCRQFDGYKPCEPHKRDQVHCDACPHYDPVRENILIIKLGAAGEVIRCTPILRRLQAEHPQARIVWMTRHPDLVPESAVDQVLPAGWEAVEWLKAQVWTLVLSLDKDPLACAVAGQLRARRLRGFVLDDLGRIAPANLSTIPKWRSGVFDDVMKARTQHYIEEIFEICGWPFTGEPYILPAPQPTMMNPLPSGQPVVGLNTGVGSAWPTRTWPVGHFESLIKLLHAERLCPVLLGGPSEHDRNAGLARRTGAAYHGIKPLREFLSVVGSCDVVVTSVTMALHMAIGLGKPVVLLNNIFNRHEFHLFGRGEILEPPVPCLACYKSRYDAACAVADCMAEITPGQVFEAVRRQLSRAAHQEKPDHLAAAACLASRR